MKLRRYENFKIIVIVSVILIFIEVVFFIQLFINKIDKYKTFSAVVQKDDIVVLMLNQYELDLFYKNHYFYLDGKKKKFKIYKVTRDVLSRNDESYHEVLIEFSFSNIIKEKDVFHISILEKKIKIIEVFKLILEV